MVGFALSLIALWGLAFLLTSDAWGIVYPLAYRYHLHPVHWFFFALGVVAAAWPAQMLHRHIPPLLWPATLRLIQVLGGVLALTLVADVQRSLAIARFAPERSAGQSFLHSLRTAPREPQLVLHAAMLKDCTAYGWSYRALEPYEIPEPAIANVLPPEWVAPGTRCGPVSN